MEAKERTQVSISRKLYTDIKEYCTLNGLKLSEYVDGLLKDAFLRDKYGDRPFVANKPHEIEEKEEISPEIPPVGEKNDEEVKQNAPKEVIIDTDVAKNEVLEPPEPVRDTVSQEVSRKVARNEETATIPDTPAEIDGKQTKKRKIQVK